MIVEREGARRALEARLDGDRALAELVALLRGDAARPGDLTACIVALGAATERGRAARIGIVMDERAGGWRGS